MLIKAVILFLVAMVAVAMIGNVLYPGALRRQVRKRLAPGKAAACPRCGRPKIGHSCDCKTKG